MAELLKDIYSPAYLAKVGQAFKREAPHFDDQGFVDWVQQGEWPELALKARMARIREGIHRFLALPYAEAVPVVLAAAPEFGSYEGMFFPDYISEYGLDDWELSIQALEVLTAYSSSEFAVRPFILKDTPRMMAQMQQWSLSDNYHVRRLASEGCRPRLPWAQALPAFKKDPSLILPILAQLRNDPSDYVHRSVANNLNDIAKDHPDMVVAWAKQYQGESKITDWVIRHASRTLLKQAHPEVMAFYGYSASSHVQVEALELSSNSISIGEALSFSFTLRSLSAEALGKLRIEYVIDYLKANGKHQSKVFKLSEADYAAPEVRLSRRQSFRQMSTRVHYAGLHRVAIRVNGEVKANAEFTLLPA